MSGAEVVTVDQDTTIMSRKQEALYTYEGPRGYQPMLAMWAQMDAVLADEFEMERNGTDGSVDGGKSGVRRAAQNSDDLPLSRRCGLS